MAGVDARAGSKGSIAAATASPLDSRNRPESGAASDNAGEDEADEGEEAAAAGTIDDEGAAESTAVASVERAAVGSVGSTDCELVAGWASSGADIGD